jgi:hypothetical protein
MRRGLALGSAILVSAAASVLVFSPSVPHPQALPSVQSSRDYGPVPTGVQLLYGADSSNPLWLTAFDWQGNPRGTLKLPAPLSHELVPQPHCFVLEDQQTFDEVLYTEVPGQSRRRVGVFANEGSLGQTGVEAVECNFRRNFGIAVRTAVGRPTDAWVIRLSDAARLAHWSYETVLGVIPSTDGSLVAENGANGSVTRIRSVPDGAVLATLPATDHVLGFSDDDRFAVIGPVVSVAPVRVIDWHMAGEVWHYGGGGWVMRVAVNPGAGDLALAIGTDDQYYSLTQDATYSMVIVHPDGSTSEIPGKYAWILPPYADGYYPYKGGPA